MLKTVAMFENSWVRLWPFLRLWSCSKSLKNSLKQTVASKSPKKVSSKTVAILKTVAMFSLERDCGKTVAILENVAMFKKSQKSQKSWACGHVWKVSSKTMTILETVAMFKKSQKSLSWATVAAFLRLWPCLKSLSLTVAALLRLWPCWKTLEKRFKTDWLCSKSIKQTVVARLWLHLKTTVAALCSARKRLWLQKVLRKSWARLWPFLRLWHVQKVSRKVSKVSSLWPCSKSLERICGHSRDCGHVQKVSRKVCLEQLWLHSWDCGRVWKAQGKVWRSQDWLAVIVAALCSSWSQSQDCGSSILKTVAVSISGCFEWIFGRLWLHSQLSMMSQSPQVKKRWVSL